MMKKLNSYIQNVFYEIRDFDYTDASYGELQGKYFQILLIYSDKSKLPIFSKKNPIILSLMNYISDAEPQQ